MRKLMSRKLKEMKSIQWFMSLTRVKTKYEIKSKQFEIKNLKSLSKIIIEICMIKTCFQGAMT